MAMRCLYRSWEYLSEIYSGGYSEGLRSYCEGIFILNYMCLGVVIFARSLSHTRRNVKTPLISFSRDWQHKNISLSYKYWLEDWQYRSDILY